MKKSYVRPKIIFESFSMSSDVAAGCAYISNHLENQCAVNIGDIVVIASGICQWTAPDVSGLICYQAPADENRVFSS